MRAVSDEERRRGALRRRRPTSATISSIAKGKPSLLFTENETNNQRVFGTPNAGPYVKDGINDFVVAGRAGRRQSGADGDQGGRALPARRGAGTDRSRPASADQDRAQTRLAIPSASAFAQMMERRRREADEFYRAITPAGVSEDAANVMRQALAGMLWSKQYYFFDLAKWLEEHGGDAGPGEGPGDAEPRMGAYGQ